MPRREADYPEMDVPATEGGDDDDDDDKNGEEEVGEPTGKVPEEGDGEPTGKVPLATAAKTKATRPAPAASDDDCVLVGGAEAACDMKRRMLEQQIASLRARWLIFIWGSNHICAFWGIVIRSHRAYSDSFGSVLPSRGLPRKSWQLKRLHLYRLRLLWVS